MLFEGCQGKKGPEIQEKTCPNCGNTVEIISTESCAVCEECGFTVYNDLMDCVFRCPEARQCVGEETYKKLMAARAQWQQDMESQMGDEW